MFLLDQKKITQRGVVTTIEIPYESFSDTLRLLLRSDAHHDSAECVRSLEKAHLEEAVESGALICDFGDIFDVMQGTGDKRGSKSAIKPEYKRDDYANAVVEDAAKFYTPYADNWAMFGYGNHETKFIKYSNVDLIRMLLATLKAESGIKAVRGVYSGYVVLVFYRHGEKRHAVRKFVISYTHGGGGNAPVTHGVIDVARKAVWAPDADLYVSGHNHRSWFLELRQERLTPNNRLKYHTKSWVKTPTYKDKSNSGFGWETEKQMPPPVLGAYWVDIGFDSRNKNRVKHKVYKAN